VTEVVQHEPEAARAARRKRCDDLLAGKLQSLEFVTDLDLHNLQLGDAEMSRVFDRIESALGIVALRIGFNVLREGAMRALAQSRLSERLETLDLTGNALGGAGVAALCEGRFPRLRELSLGWCRLGDGAVVPLAASASMPALRELTLRRNELGDEGALTLAASTALRAQLTRLSFDYNDDVTRRGMARLRDAYGDALVD